MPPRGVEPLTLPLGRGCSKSFELRGRLIMIANALHQNWAMTAAVLVSCSCHACPQNFRIITQFEHIVSNKIEQPVVFSIGDGSNPPVFTIYGLMRIPPYRILSTTMKIDVGP